MDDVIVNNVGVNKSLVVPYVAQHRLWGLPHQSKKHLFGLTLTISTL